MPDKLLVVGAGLMGAGIAQVAAQAGYSVVLLDLGPAQLDRALADIDRSLGRFEAKGKLTAEERASTVGRISTTTDLEAAGDAELVVEAVFEEVETKRAVFRRLDELAPAGVVLASNTSAIPITTIAAATSRPEAVVGTHFFSPVPMMTLCELVRGYRTADETLERARAFAERCGKTTVTVEQDIAGFVTTRLIAVVAMEAARLVERGVASAADLDTACRLAFGWPMGPMATMDLTGVDVLLHAASNIFDDTADPKFFPPELVRRMVAAGELGRKTGKGFFEYPA